MEHPQLQDSNKNVQKLTQVDISRYSLFSLSSSMRENGHNVGL